jgi:hypothetical protein
LDLRVPYLYQVATQTLHYYHLRTGQIFTEDVLKIKLLYYLKDHVCRTCEQTFSKHIVQLGRNLDVLRDLCFLVEPFLVARLKVHSYGCSWSSNYINISLVHQRISGYQKLLVVNYLKLVKLALRLDCNFFFTTLTHRPRWTSNSTQLINTILYLRLHLLIVLSV